MLSVGPAIAKDAFKAVKEHFRQSSSLSDQEKALLTGTNSVEDVQKTVAELIAKHEAKSESSKTRRWLQRASETMCYYSKVFDVLVQHHAEYVSLVWGVMKLLFMSAGNHGETLKLFAKSLVEVALRLPRVEIVSELYSTKHMRLAVESLYSSILEFLLIAHSWCNESRFSHICHSFTRPPELRYGDLLERIENCSKNINELATVGSQAELRGMHETQSTKLNDIISILKSSEDDRKIQLDGLSCAVSRLEASSREHGHKLNLVLRYLEASGSTVNDLLAKIETFHSIQTSAQLDTNQQLSDLQLSQALSTFAQIFEDPDQCYKHHLFLRNRRACGHGPMAQTNEFWLSPKLAKWSSSSNSSLAIIRGSFTSRSPIVDFGVDVIQTLASSAAPTLWALKSGQRKRAEAMLSMTDLMKYLTFQALRLSGAVKSEKQLSLRYSQLHAARTLREWLDLFSRVVGGLGGQIYLIVDLATVRSSLEGEDGLGLIKELSNMSKDGFGPNVKIVLLVYEPEWFKSIPKEVTRRVSVHHPSTGISSDLASKFTSGIS
ncbi:hypothetical protein ACJZ2D_010276 [Fusarium nematophilum]